MTVRTSTALTRPRRLSSGLRPERPSADPGAPEDLPQCLNARLIQVTPVDIRCIVPHHPQVGDPQKLTFLADGQRITVEGIVHWKMLQRSEFEIGLHLPDGLPGALCGLMARSRRRENRYRCRVSGRYVAARSGGGGSGVVVNYSHDGFGLLASSHCDVDDHITFQWTCERSIQQITGQVLWRIDQEGGTLLGCQTEPGAGYRIAGVGVRQRLRHSREPGF